MHTMTLQQACHLGCRQGLALVLVASQGYHRLRAVATTRFAGSGFGVSALRRELGSMSARNSLR